MISHKLAWTLSIGTFLFGTFADSWLNLQRPLPTVEVDTSYWVPDPNVTLIGRIQIELISKETISRTQREATFKVTNRTGNTVYYSGYEGGTVPAWIRTGGSVTDAWNVECWMGIETFSLRTTESAYFTIPIPPKSGYFDVGFDFRIGLRAGWETVWFRFPEYPDRRR